ncbi:hemerythrin domain-containing protein [Chloroflexota bacterium]
MEDVIALLDQITEEHQTTFRRLKDLGQVVNDVEAIAGLEKSRESFVPGRLDQKAGLQKMQDILEIIAKGLEDHFNCEETRLLGAFERHGDRRLASTLNSLLQEHGEIRQRFANSQSQIAELAKGEMSQNLWAASANDMRAYLNHSLKLVEKHAGVEQTLLTKLRKQLAGELKK